MSLRYGSSESYEETIELQSRTTSDMSQYQIRVIYDDDDVMETNFSRLPTAGELAVDVNTKMPSTLTSGSKHVITHVNTDDAVVDVNTKMPLTHMSGSKNITHVNTDDDGVDVNTKMPSTRTSGWKNVAHINTHDDDVDEEEVPTDILVNLQDETYSSHKSAKTNHVQYSPRSNGPLISNGKRKDNKDKYLTFSESTDHLLSAKTSPTKENGLIDDAGRMICVNVNKNSLKSSTPLQIDSKLVQKTSKEKERETML